MFWRIDAKSVMRVVRGKYGIVGRFLNPVLSPIFFNMVLGQDFRARWMF